MEAFRKGGPLQLSARKIISLFALVACMLATTHEQRMACDKCNKPGGVHLVSTKNTVFCSWIFAFVMCHALLLGACQHACHKYRKEMDVLASQASLAPGCLPGCFK